MKVESILNADMATLQRAMLSGLAWWRDELAAMLPAARLWPSRSGRMMALYRADDGLRLFKGGVAVTDARKPGAAPICVDMALPAAVALIRDIDVPTMNQNELRQMVRIEAERLLPLSGRDVVADGAIIERETTPGRMGARVAGIRRETAIAAIAAASEAAILPDRLGLLLTGQPDRISFDFAPALRAEGLLPPPRRAMTVWWTLVGVGILLNLALLVIRDTQRTDRLAALVEAQAPAVAVSRAVAGRIQTSDANARALVARRQSHDALADLAAASETLPGGAWVQRYEWDGRMLHLTGYRPAAVDALAGLRRSRRFANVRVANDDVIAGNLAGQPFDISIDLTGIGR